MKKFVLIFCLLLLLTSFTNVATVFAQGQSVSCPNRYVTLVNPVRGRDLWSDKSLKPIQGQVNAISENNFPATWLLQNNVLFDPNLLSMIKSFPGNQEKGMLVEISQELADQAKVYYPIDVPWYSPKAVFLSGYSESQRRNLIDTMFNNFKQKFGFYPSSVGAWWIDSYSLNYMREKYAIKAAMIVADQKITDSYGVWGQWWGVPYYPSRANILVPADNLSDKQAVTIIQWAQRDPVLAYGSGPKVSNYSLQANDYIRQGKDTEYFKDISSVYLDCSNPIGQVTVGLETGQESVGYLDEYHNQLNYLKSQIGIQTVTMSTFADKFASVYPGLPQNMTLKYQNNQWNLNTRFRQNKGLGDFISYNQESAFPDYFLADKSKFLNRDLSLKGNTKNEMLFPWYLILIFIAGAFLYYKKIFSVWLGSLSFMILSFGLILRSDYELGYKVFYGPVVGSLVWIKIILFIFSLAVIGLSAKLISLKTGGEWRRYIVFYPVLGFALIQLFISARYTQISASRWFGILTDPFHFIGIGLSSRGVSFINKNLLNYQAAALLRLDLAKIWQIPLLWLVFLPLLCLVVGVILTILVYKLSAKLRVMILAILLVLVFVYVNGIFSADPRVVIPIT